MTTLDDVARAWRAIAKAEDRYREVLRSALDDGVQQVDISKRIGRTREMLRRDAMSDAEREQLRKADVDRKKRKQAK